MRESKTPMVLAAPTEVQLRIVSIESVPAEVLERYRGWFTSTERAAYDSFRSERRCREFVVGRGLLRMALGAELNVEPQRLEFVPDERGKLHLLAPSAAGSAHFNLTHTHDVVVCATCRDYPVGVDIERTAGRVQPLELAQRFFRASESEILARISGSIQLDRFFVMWTLKEALVKAYGFGVFASTQTTHFDISETGVLEAASWDAQFRDAWLATAKPSAQHRLAVCVLCPDTVDVRVTVECNPANWGQSGEYEWLAARLENRSIPT